MSLDIEAFKKALDEDLADPNGYWNTLMKKKEQEELRYDRFEKWLETNEFEPVFQKLLQRNGDERSRWCYNRGYQKYGTPLMEFLCNYISHRVEQKENDKIKGDFQAGLWYFKGYWFELVCGQGCFWAIYDENLNIVENV